MGDSMKVKDPKKINIQINGDESNKSEIIYNNVIHNMNLDDKEQIEYLKAKITHLELELKTKSLTYLLCIISILGLGFGIFLLAQDIYILGILFIVSTFVGVILRFYLMYKNVVYVKKNGDYDKIEQLRRILNERLK